MQILLIRLRLVGDVVFTTPAFDALRRRFPDAHLTYLVEPGAAPVVAGHPALTDVIVIPRSRGWRRVADDLSLARRLRARRFDVVVDFHGGPRASWLAWATGAPRRIGYTIRGRGWMYTDRVPRSRDLAPRHSVENQWDLLGRLDVPPPDRASNPVTMAESSEAAARVEARLRRHGIDRLHQLIVVHVSAGNPFRRWPLESFSELAASLASAAPARRIVFTSGPSDARAASEVAAAARSQLGPDRADRIAECGEFDLAELRALIARAALYIGGDSGPLHVAATTRTPIVGIYGPTLAERSAPWRPDDFVTESVYEPSLPCRPCDQRVCVHGDFRCLGLISPSTVAAAAERALERSRRAGSGDVSRTAAAADVQDARKPAAEASQIRVIHAADPKESGFRTSRVSDAPAQAGGPRPAVRGSAEAGVHGLLLRTGFAAPVSDAASRAIPWRVRGIDLPDPHDAPTGGARRRLGAGRRRDCDRERIER